MTSNPAAMTERLIDAAIYAETASGPYVSAARKEVNDARADIEAALEERDRLKVERDEARASLNASRNLVERRTKQRDSEAERADGNWDAAQAAEARALAAEAERDALREALAPFGSGAVVFYENEPDDCVLSLGRWKYQEDGRARFYADVQLTVADVRRARALTEKNNGNG